MKNQIAFLKGKKTILRPIERSDAPLLTKWINDPDVRVFLKGSYPLSELAEERWIEEKLKKENDFTLGIVDTKTSKLIGTMGLHQILRIHGTALTGALIGEKSYWGKGYGSDAKMALLDWAFNTLNLRKICSRVIAFNERSYAYSKKCGYVEEARLKDHYFRNGKYYDQIILSVFREDWLPLGKKYFGK